MLGNYLQNIKSILCLNGELEDSEIFHCNKPIIAADGAADKLKLLGVKPDIIIGDLDSVNIDDHQDVEMLHCPDQNYSDFQKSLKYLEEAELLPTLVCGFGGGFLDHILYNINIIAGSDCIFYAPPIIGEFFAAGSKFVADLPLNTKLSIIAMPSAIVSTSGLKWNLDNSELEFPGVSSCFNRTNKQHIEIDIITGKILLMIYSSPVVDCGGS